MLLSHWMASPCHPLHRWCRRQRERYRGAAAPPLSEEEAAELEQVPGWYW